VAGYKYGNKPLGSVEDREFLDQLIDCQVLNDLGQ
jgi:hypothetical protein